jgi:hypothetical protein
MGADNHTGRMLLIMSRRLNEGEAFEILNGRINRHSGRPRASLAALQWAADRAGLSYGIFTQHLSPADEANIQEEYEKQREVSVDTE